MKYLWPLIVVLSCCNNPKTENDYSDDTLRWDSVKNGKPANPPKKNQVTRIISQQDIVLNESVIISNEFYNNLVVQNYQGANKYLHPDALTVTPVNEWIEIYRKAQTKTGKLAYVNMIAHGSKCGIKGENGLGDYAELIFDAQYKDGNLREKLSFFRKDSTEAVKILGYEYNQVVDLVKLSEMLR